MLCPMFCQRFGTGYKPIRPKPKGRCSSLTRAKGGTLTLALYGRLTLSYPPTECTHSRVQALGFRSLTLFFKPLQALCLLVRFELGATLPLLSAVKIFYENLTTDGAALPLARLPAGAGHRIGGAVRSALDV